MSLCSAAASNEQDCSATVASCARQTAYASPAQRPILMALESNLEIVAPRRAAYDTTYRVTFADT